jgi:hypothetical protein
MITRRENTNIPQRSSSSLPAPYYGVSKGRARTNKPRTLQHPKEVIQIDIATETKQWRADILQDGGDLKKTPWSESGSELYRPIERCMSAK